MLLRLSRSKKLAEWRGWVVVSVSVFKCLQGLSGILAGFPRKMLVIEWKAAHVIKQFNI